MRPIRTHRGKNLSGRGDNGSYCRGIDGSVFEQSCDMSRIKVFVEQLRATAQGPDFPI